MKAYYLSKHVFVCVEGRYLVFLDLANDEYFCVAQDDLNSLPISIVGMPRAASRLQRQVGDTMERAESTLTRLISQQIITEDAAGGKSFAAIPMQAVNNSLVDVEPSIRGRARSDETWHFLAASLSATAQLKIRPLKSIIARVILRKAHHSPHQPSPITDRCVELVNAFRRLRPTFPREYLCLFDSLALIEFLARYDVFPDWIFGIQLSPFSAHCWVQRGTTVLNDSVGNVQHYNPIMAV